MGWAMEGGAADEAKPTAPAESSPNEAEPAGKIEGMAFARAKGGYLGIAVVGGNFKLSFYDAKKKPAAVDVARATLRWPVKYQKMDEHIVMTASGGEALTSTFVVRPPLLFKLRIALFAEGSDEAVESYVVDFRG